MPLERKTQETLMANLVSAFLIGVGAPGRGSPDHVTLAQGRPMVRAERLAACHRQLDGWHYKAGMKFKAYHAVSRYMAATTPSWTRGDTKINAVTMRLICASPSNFTAGV